MLEGLAKNIRNSLEKITRLALVDKGALDALIRDVQRALLSADVNVKLVYELSERIKDRAFDKLPKGLSRNEYVIKLVYEELTRIMGEKPAELNLKPHKVLLIGLFGSGKTTTAAKLARFYQKKGLKVCLVCCDTFRPAAYKQLEQLASSINVHFFGMEHEKDSRRALRAGLDFSRGYDITIIDSSGRDALDKELIQEIKDLNEIAKPEERILVIPADIGQSSQKQAEEFEKALGITGVIVTKMDATAKAGGALTACNATSAKIQFITVGEKTDALEFYEPKKFVSRLIGFGDLEGLLEKAKEHVDEKAAKNIMSGEFTLDDFINQLDSMQKMGPLSGIMDMMGLGGVSAKMPKEELEKQQEKMKKWRFIVQGMTPEERAKPEIINFSRSKRIARGSGVSEGDVRELVRSFEKSRKMMKKLNPEKLEKTMKRSRGSGGAGFASLLKKFGMK